MQKIDSNFWEFKFLGLNATAFSLCMMENPSFQAGAMEKLEHFYLNLVNFFTL